MFVEIKNKHAPLTKIIEAVFSMYRYMENEKVSPIFKTWDKDRVKRLAGKER